MLPEMEVHQFKVKGIAPGPPAGKKRNQQTAVRLGGSRFHRQDLKAEGLKSSMWTTTEPEQDKTHHHEPNGLEDLP